MNHFERLISEKIFSVIGLSKDPAHDELHIKRVVKTAKDLCDQEKASMAVVMPAAYLHDLINVPKNDPRRSQASKLSAEAAIDFLKTIHYPQEFYNDIYHAIAAHSFSANIETQTIEAKIVQDADRLDGLGAIGIARCFVTAGLLNRSIYSENDPFCEHRETEDQKYTIDHFYQKLFKVIDTLKTVSGQNEGRKRGEDMKRFLADLKSNL